MSAGSNPRRSTSTLLRIGSVLLVIALVAVSWSAWSGSRDASLTDSHPPERTVIERPEYRLVISGEADWDSPADLPSGETTPFSLPALRSGSIRLEVDAEKAGGLELSDGVRVTAGSVLESDGVEWTILEGRVLLGQRSLVPGGRFEYRSDRESRERSQSAPPPVVDDGPVASGLGSLTVRVRDARTAEPIVGAAVVQRVVGTAIGVPRDPDTLTLQRATDGRGSIEFEASFSRPQYVHVQVDAPGYGVRSRVVGPLGRSGLETELTIDLFAQGTTSTLFSDERGQPLADLPVRVVRARRDRYVPFDFDATAIDVEATSSERHFTDADGFLRVAEGWQIIDLSTVAGPRFGGAARPFEKNRALQKVRRDPRVEDLYVVQRALLEQRFTIADRAGVPLTRCPIFCELQGRAFFTWTDDSGELSLGVIAQDPPLSVQPATARLRIDDPRAFRQIIDLQIPSPVNVGRTESDRPRLWDVQFVATRDDRKTGALDNLDLVRSANSLDWALWEQGDGGHATFIGGAPSNADEVDFDLPGFVRSTAVLPLDRYAKTRVDLGVVELSRGASIDVVGRDAANPVIVAARDVRRLRRVDQATLSSPTTRLSGFELGQRVEWSVAVPYGPPALRIIQQAEEFIDAARLREGWFAPTVARQSLTIEGRVVGLADDDAGNRVRVIERWYLGEPDDPAVFGSRPVPEDGRLGSVRSGGRLPEFVEVIVQVSDQLLGQFGPEPVPGVSVPGVSAAGVPSARVTAERRVDIGRVDLLPTRRARVRFEARGLGRIVAPRSGLELIAGRHRNHELVDLRVVGETLELIHLLEGDWTLTLTRDGRVDSLPFRVPADRDATTLDLTFVVEPDGPQEIVLIVEDSSGDPVTDGRIASRVSSLIEFQKGFVPEPPAVAVPFPASEDFLGGRESTAPGQYVVSIDPRQPTAIEFITKDRSTGFSLFVPVEATVPSRVAIEPVGSVDVRIFEPSGDPAFGSFLVAWPATSIDSGMEKGVQLREGRSPKRFDIGGAGRLRGLPVGLRTYRIDRVGTEQRARQRLSVNAVVGGTSPTRVDLQERRTLAGVVVGPGGAAASGARVQIVPRDEALPLPLRDRDPGRSIAVTEADADGHFELDATGIDLDRDLSLVAVRDGWVAAIEDPIVLDRRQRLLRLGLGTDLTVRTSSSSDASHRFDLSYDPLDSRFPRIELGSIGPGADFVFVDILPGRYRLRRDLGLALPGFRHEDDEQTIRLRGGESRQLVLPVHEQRVSATATLNGLLVTDGWLIVLEDPSRTDLAFVTDIESREFEARVPAEFSHGFATIVPRVNGTPRESGGFDVIDFRTGSALPVPVEVIDGRLEVSMVRFDVTFEFDDAIEATDIDIALEIEASRWDGSDWEATNEIVRIPVLGSRVVWPLLPRGLHRYEVRSTTGFGWTRSGFVELIDDPVTVRVREP